MFENIKNNKRSFLYLIIIGVLLSFIAILTFSYDYKINGHTLFGKFAKFSTKCTFKTDNPLLQKYSKMTKTENYLTQEPKEVNDEYVNTCFMTVWHSIHFLVYLTLGFMFPLFWKEVLIGATLFEFYEYLSCNCHDVTDIFWNTLGVFIGYNLNRMLLKGKNII